MKNLFLLIFIFCLTCNFFAQTQIEQEEYTVYQTILGSKSNIAISKFTYIDDDSAFKIKRLKQDLRIVQSRTRKDFKKKNKKYYELKNNFLTKKKVHLLSFEDLRPFYEIADYNEFAAEKAFLEKYETVSVITLSRVGFNRDKTQALVGVVSNSGFCGTCSTAYLIVLSKEKDEWKIVKKVITWIS